MENIIIFAILISCGYFFGRYTEKKHFRSIAEREEKLLLRPITSSKYPLEQDEIETARLVQGGVVVSIDYFKRILAGLRNIFGGNVLAYETLLDRARREATLRLRESCLDADEIINLRIETSSISKGGNNRIGCVEVLAYGTAIYYKK